MSRRGGTVRIGITADTAGLSRGIAKAQTEIRRLGQTRLDGIGRSASQQHTPIARIGTTATQATSRLEVAGVRARKALGGIGVAAQRTAAVARRAFLAIGTAAATAGLSVGAGVKQAISFEKAMRNVNSIAQLSEQGLKQLNDEVLRMAGRTAQAPQTLAEGLYDLVSSGFEGRDAMKVLEASARAATAGLTSTEVSAGAVAAVLNAYKLPASEAGKVSDQLFRTVDRGVVSFEQLASTVGDVLPFASSLGVGLDQVGASVATMTKAGISAPETMTRIKAVMTSMLKPGKALSAAIEELGYESGEQLVKAKGFQGALDALAKSTGGSKQELAALFPNVRALGGALALTGKNSAGARKDLEGMRDASGATARALAQQSKSVAYQWNRLKALASSLGIQIGSKLLPPLTGLLRGMSGILQRAPKVASSLKRAFAAGQRGSGQGYTGLAGMAADVSRALPGAGSAKSGLKAGLAGKTDQQTAGYGGVGKVAVQVGQTLRTVAAGAKQAGQQLLDALKPAAPFLQNVLLPLLKGIGQGVAVSVVAAFRVAVPVLKVFMGALGAVGKAAAPFKGVIQGIGTAVGFVLAGPILKALGVIPKLGIVFRAAAMPITALGKAVGWLGGILGKGAQWFAGWIKYLVPFRQWMAPIPRLLVTVGAAVVRLTTPLQVAGRAFGKLAQLAGQAASKLGGKVADGVGVAAAAVGNLAGLIAGKVSSIAGAVGKVASAVIRPFVKLGGRIIDHHVTAFNRVRDFVGGPGASKAKEIGSAIASAIVDGVKRLPQLIREAFSRTGQLVADIGRSIRNWLNDSTPFGNEIKLGPARVRLPRLRGGGGIDGMFLGAGGEMVVHPDGRAFVLGGNPRADHTLAWAPPGSAVITGHGQQLLAAGMPMHAVLRDQLPHFRRGGPVGPAGASVYGGPRDPSTRKPERGYRGDLLERVPMSYAELGMGRAMGGLPYRHPLKITYKGRSVIARKRDIGKGGGDVNGRRRVIDLYYRVADKLGFPWGVDTVRLSSASGADTPSRGTGRDGGVEISVPRVFGANPLRRGLLDDAFGAAFDAARAGRPQSALQRRAAIAEALAGVQTSRKVQIAGASPARGGSGTTGAAGSGGGWQRPVSGPVTSGFGPRRSPGGIGSTNHQGIDFGVPIGTPVRAARSGQVTFTGTRGGYGKTVLMSHPGGWGTLYGHLNSISTRVGRRPRGGQVIARSGSTGNSTGPHLHFETRRNGRPVDPRSVVRMRAGGVVGAPVVKRSWAQPTTTTGASSALERAMAAHVDAKKGSAAALQQLIDDMGLAAVNQLRVQLEQAVKRGGSAKLITRLQAALDMVYGTLGDRAGALMAAVDRRNQGVSVADTYRQLGLRRRGVEADSVEALQSEREFVQRSVIRATRMNVGQIKGAIKRARAAGDKQRVAELEQELRDAMLAIDEGLVRHIELGREIARAQIEQVRRAQDNRVARVLAEAEIGFGGRVAAHTEAYRLAEARMFEAWRSGEDGQIAEAATQLKQAADALQEAARTQAYQGFTAVGDQLAAQLIAAQIATPGSEGEAVRDDLAVVQQQLANATAAYQQAVARGDLAEQVQWGQEVLNLRGTVESLNEAITRLSQTAEQQLELERQAREEAQRAARIAQSQTDVLAGWITDALGRRIGGRAGRGLGAASYAGATANL